MVEPPKSTDKEFITSFEDDGEKPHGKILKKRTFKEIKETDPEAPVGPDIKKKPKFDFDEIVLENLPKAELYERSLMHRDIINHSKKELFFLKQHLHMNLNIYSFSISDHRFYNNNQFGWAYKILEKSVPFDRICKTF